MMATIRQSRNIARVAALIALLIGILGPWLYNSDGVPPPEWCRPPLFLLDSERCVELVSGVTVIAFVPTALLSLASELVTGTLVLVDRARELIGMSLFLVSVCLLLLPFLSTLLVIRRGDSRRLRMYHVLAWGAAAIVSLLPSILNWIPRLPYFWGNWLYTGLAIIVLALETFALATDIRRAKL